MDQNHRQGFTLIELLVYTAIFAIVAGLLSSVFYLVINSQKKESVATEVNSQLNFVLTTIQRLVGDSALVEAVYEGNSPSSTCTDFCTLKLRTTDPAKDPTIISSNATGIYLQEGSSSQVTLTNDKININHARFTKHEIPGGHAVVEISTAFSYNTNNPRFAVTKAIESAIARVNAATFDADLLPNQDNTFDIGQVAGSNLRWRNGHFSQNLTIAGSVGIGLTSPSYRLDVSGTVNASEFYKNGSPFSLSQVLAYNEFTSDTNIPASMTTIVTASGVTINTGDIIEVEAYLPQIEGDGGGTLTVALYDNGSSIGELGYFSHEASASSTEERSMPGYFKRRLQPSGGSHTYSIRAKRSAPNWHINADDGGSGDLVPGFIKVLKLN